MKQLYHIFSNPDIWDIEPNVILCCLGYLNCSLHDKLPIGGCQEFLYLELSLDSLAAFATWGFWRKLTLRKASRRLLLTLCAEISDMAGRWLEKTSAPAFPIQCKSRMTHLSTEILWHGTVNLFRASLFTGPNSELIFRWLVWLFMNISTLFPELLFTSSNSTVQHNQQCFTQVHEPTRILHSLFVAWQPIIYINSKQTHWSASDYKAEPCGLKKKKIWPFSIHISMCHWCYLAHVNFCTALWGVSSPLLTIHDSE